jgi:hypothetical protein
MSEMLFSIGLLFAVQSFVDLNDPAILQLVRALYIGLSAAHFFLITSLPDRIAAAADAEAADLVVPGSAAPIRPSERPIWVPETDKIPGAGGAGVFDAIFGKTTPAAGAGAGAAPGAPAVPYRKLTVRSYELELAKKLGDAVLSAKMGPLMFSFFMNIHVMLAMNTARMPFEVLRVHLVKKYVLGQDLGDRPLYAGGEKYDDPEAVAQVPQAEAEAIEGDDATTAGDAATDAATATTTATSSRRKATAAVDGEMEEAIFRTWEAKHDPVAVDMFEALVGPEKRKSPNYRTAEDGWTALMVVAGGNQNGPAEVSDMLRIGARPEVADREGWTALHWAAFHSCAPAIATIADAYSGDPGASPAPAPAAAAAPAGAAAAQEGPGGVPIIGDLGALRALLRARDAKGRTALALAQEEGNKAEVAALEVALAKAKAAAGGEGEGEGDGEGEEEGAEPNPALANSNGGMRKRGGRKE